MILGKLYVTGFRVVSNNRKKTTAKSGRSNGNGKKLTATDISRFQEILLAKRRELIGDVNEMHDEALKNARSEAAGDLSSMPIHMADIGSDVYQQEIALGLMDGERKLLKKIDEALDRISQGIYGTCQGTGKPITKARLEAKPWARYSVQHATMIEKGLVKDEPQ